MNRVKIIIAGGRNFDDYDTLHQVCDMLIGKRSPASVEIVSGTARGADKLGEGYAANKGYTVKQFAALWDVYGKSAGYKRNKQMAEYADVLIAFWDGKSRGTGHMINLAREHDLIVYVHNY